MSGCEPEGVPFGDDMAADGFEDADQHTDPWCDEQLVEDVPQIVVIDEAEVPTVDADIGLDGTDVEAVELTGDPVELPPEPATGLGANVAWGDASGDPVDAWVDDDRSLVAAELAHAPVIYERDSLVSQVPVADDLLTVEAVTESAVYEQWVAAAGGDADLAATATGGLDPAVSAFDRPGTIGDAGDGNFWFKQNSQFSCGPSSVAQIISDFSGVQHPNEFGLAAYAEAQGWYDPNTGMQADNVAKLLTDQGVPSRVERDQDFGDVEQYLREGRAVVMFLDGRDVVPAGYEAYAAEDQAENSDADTVDHFVRVIGIDREAGVAIIANPAFAEGAQMEVPLAQLEEAWNDNTVVPGYPADRAHMLIVSDGADPTADDLGQPTPQPAPVPQPTSQGSPGPDPAPVPQPTSQGSPGPGPAPPSVPSPAPQGSPTSPGLPGPEPQSPPLVAANAPPSEVVLQSEGVELPSFAPPAGADVVLPSAPPAVSIDAEQEDEGLFDAVPGWVLIPVTLAAGRLGAAVVSRRGVASR